MFRPALGLIGILTFLLVPYSSHAQQAEAPVYKDGDWWRVKVDVVRPAGVSVSGPQYWDAFQSTSSNLSRVDRKSLALKETNLKKPTHPPLLPWSWVEPDGGVIC